MKINEITTYLETIAPLSFQENYDNSGLIVGNPETEVRGVLICLDCIERVVDEAIRKKANLIIAHHPIVFSGLKRLNGKNYIERTVIKAIKNDVAIYAIHTNLDNVKPGVNRKIAEKIGLKNLKILTPKPGMLRKLVLYAPVNNMERVKSALFEIGVGEIGNYKGCSFTVTGNESFTPMQSAQPFKGEKGQPYMGESAKVEMIFPEHLEKKVIKTIHQNHPYEVPAYDLIPVVNLNSEAGSGMMGELEKPVDEMGFLKMLKKVFHAKGIRYTQLRNKPVKKIAVCGGSGSFLLGKAMGAGADFLVTADFKYHQFFDAEDKLVIADIGHYESEQFTIELIEDLLCEKFSKFAVYLSDINTNPINYL